MELKVNKPTFPEVIEFNFQELKKEITERASAYVNLVYTEDQIKDAKKDRATLNKFVKALSDERIKIKKECLKAYEDFETKIKELDSIVNVAIKNIDDQVKAFDEQKKAEKLEVIKELWESLQPPEGLPFERVFQDKFLNASVNIKTIKQYLIDSIEKFNEELEILSNLPEFSFEAVEVYKTTFNLNEAISEGKRLAEIQKRKAEAELAKQQEPEEQLPGQVSFHDSESFEQCIPKPEPVKEWISFKALLTPEDALQLREFFVSRNIQYMAIN